MDGAGSSPEVAHDDPKEQAAADGTKIDHDDGKHEELPPAPRAERVSPPPEVRRAQGDLAPPAAVGRGLPAGLARGRVCPWDSGPPLPFLVTPRLLLNRVQFCVKLRIGLLAC